MSKTTENIVWIGFFFVSLFFLGTIVAPLMGSFPAPTVEAAARQVVAKYNNGDQHLGELTFSEVTTGAGANGSRSVVFKDRDGAVRYRVQLRKAPFGRWGEESYMRVDPAAGAGPQK